MGFALLCFIAPGWSAEPAAVQQHDVVFTGPFGLGRTVRSETLILPNANSVLHAQDARDRRVARRETQNSAALEQKRQSEARRQAEADAMAGAEPVPADAVSAEAAILEASDASVSQPAAEDAAEVEAADAPVPVPDAAPAAADDAVSAETAEADAAAAPADEQPAEAAGGE